MKIEIDICPAVIITGDYLIFAQYYIVYNLYRLTRTSRSEITLFYISQFTYQRTAIKLLQERREREKKVAASKWQF